MEDGRRRADQAPLRRGPGAPAAAAVRAGRAPALRPGQVVPRRAAAALGVLHLLARATSEPLWTNPDLIAREATVSKATIADAGKLMGALCEQLGLPADSGLPAYEDVAYYALVEQKLPINVTPGRQQAGGPGRARAHLAHFRARPRYAGELRAADPGLAFARPRSALGDGALGHPPRQAVPDAGRFARRLPTADGVDGEPARGRLSARAAARPVRRSRPAAGARRAGAAAARHRGAAGAVPPQTGPSEIYGSVRTALAIEPRDGQLCVFLPPLSDALDFAALVAAVEEAAGKAGLPVHIEGYAPPSDARINVIKVTPDPGVIEVNIHPAASWKDVVDITTAVYEEARNARLGAEKFLLDGRHTGTGGGNHIVMGGLTPADSPFLRRPDVLASFVAYWLNHPSLSYLFSGLFIGPTSQAPRARRGAPRERLRARDRAGADPRPQQRHRAAVARRPHLPPPARRRDRQHAPRRDLHRQALFARRSDGAARSRSSSAPSRCRRTRA